MKKRILDQMLHFPPCVTSGLPMLGHAGRVAGQKRARGWGHDIFVRCSPFLSLYLSTLDFCSWISPFQSSGTLTEKYISETSKKQ